MKLRWKITMALVAVAAVPVYILLAAPSHAQRELEKTRRSLRQEGFKISLAEFNLSTSPEERKRTSLFAPTTRAAMTNRERPGPIGRDSPPLLTPARADAAV